MPLSPESVLLTAQYRLAQQTLGRQVQAAVAQAWRTLDLTRIDATWPPVASVIAQVVSAAHQRSAGQASGYLTRHAALNGVSVAPVASQGLDSGQVATSLTVTGPVALKRATQSTGLVAKASQLALVQLLGSTHRLALAGGRDVTAATVAADSSITGYQRVGGGGCQFCADLIAEGPVFGSADFQAHDHDTCIAEPVYE